MMKFVDKPLEIVDSIYGSKLVEDRSLKGNTHAVKKEDGVFYVSTELMRALQNLRTHWSVEDKKWSNDPEGGWK